MGACYPLQSAPGAHPRCQLLRRPFTPKCRNHTSPRPRAVSWCCCGSSMPFTGAKSAVDTAPAWRSSRRSPPS
eukprot:2685404-Rhodomonas_salina.2